MQAKLIEETLMKIIEIDRQAVMYEKEALESEKESNDDLGKKKKEIDFEYMKQARQEAKVQYDAILSAAREKVQSIEAEGVIECARLNGLLEKNKDEMVEKVFVRLFEVVMNPYKDES